MGTEVDTGGLHARQLHCVIGKRVAVARKDKSGVLLIEHVGLQRPIVSKKENIGYCKVGLVHVPERVAKDSLNLHRIRDALFDNVEPVSFRAPSLGRIGSQQHAQLLRRRRLKRIQRRTTNSSHGRRWRSIKEYIVHRGFRVHRIGFSHNGRRRSDNLAGKLKL